MNGRLSCAGSLLSACMLIQGCSTPTRVVLLPEPSGTSTSLEIRTADSELVLARPYELATVGRGGAIDQGQTTEAEVGQRYSKLIALRPVSDARYTLYFVSGTASLTSASEKLISELIAEASRRPGGEFIVVGHTDTVGAITTNDALSLERAQLVRQLLVKSGARPDVVEATGRGKREPLVPTGDQVDEPRNRRVEVIIR